jgi:alkylhydroperoxidase family enzyme
VGSHAGFLRSQGQDSADVDAVGTNDLTKAKGITAKEIALLEYVKILTLEPAKMTDADVQKLRKAGWNDKEIFEATFDTSLFAFFNRMADAYGLDYPMNGWKPPVTTKATTKPALTPPPPTTTTVPTAPGTGK